MFRAALSDEFAGLKLHIFEEIDSTNLEAKRAVGNADADAAAVEKAQLPALFFASRQTAGRGRLGRSFHAPDGLYFSVVFEPGFTPKKLALVTVAAAVAVVESIDEVCGVQGGEEQNRAAIKWVNDIYYNGLKVCGILSEGVPGAPGFAAGNEAAMPTAIVVGIGINTSIEGFPDELKGVAGAVPGLDGDDEETAAKKVKLVARITEKMLGFARELAEPDGEGVPAFLDVYRERSMLIGRDVKVYKGAYRKDPTVELGGVPARVLGIDDEGGLEVIYTDGSREVLTYGEVSVRNIFTESS